MAEKLQEARNNSGIGSNRHHKLDPNHSCFSLKTQGTVNNTQTQEYTNVVDIESSSFFYQYVESSDVYEQLDLIKFIFPHYDKNFNFQYLLLSWVFVLVYYLPWIPSLPGFPGGLRRRNAG